MSPFVFNSLSEETAGISMSLSAMMQQEQMVSKRCNYLDSTLPMVDDTSVTESDRMIIVDYCYSVIDQFHFDRETVAMTMDIVDRFLSKPSSIAQDALHDRILFQLIVTTALYMCIKSNEKVTIDSKAFASMSRNVYTVSEIEEMESNIRQGLSWQPTSIRIARHILSLTLPRTNLEEETRCFVLNEVQFQTELAVRDYYFATQRASTTAMATILNTLDQLDYQDHQAILHALLPVINEDAFHPEDLLAAKTRLRWFVESNDSSSDGDYDDGDTIAPENIMEPEGLSHAQGQLEGKQQYTAKALTINVFSAKELSLVVKLLSHVQDQLESEQHPVVNR